MLPVAELLTFEARFPDPQSYAKWTAIRDELGTTPVRYHLQLHRMRADEALLAEALRTDPTTTHRLLRQRDARAEARRARTRS